MDVNECLLIVLRNKFEFKHKNSLRSLQKNNIFTYVLQELKYGVFIKTILECRIDII